MKQIPFFLVTGFLGSGKTTFLKRILETYSSERKIAIIQNEFAPASIDGAELKREGKSFEILEINNGSVFCVCLLSHFVSSLEAFVKECHPDMIFLESSGLSDPIAIAQILDKDDLNQYLYLAQVWTIVDAVHFLKQQNLIKTLRRQVQIADTVIINKTDLSLEEHLQEVKKAVISLNPFTKIIECSYCDLSDTQLALDQLEQALARKKQQQHSQLKPCSRPEISVKVCKSTHAITREKLIEFIDDYAERTIRIKGLVKLNQGGGISVQTSYQQKQFKEFTDFQGPTELIAMSSESELSDFCSDYEAYTKNTEHRF